jgi:hypothetical protein
VADPLPARLRDAVMTMNAKPYAIRPCTRVYLVLVALTFVTFAVGQLGLSPGLTTDSKIPL